jgi:hypothetical protein
MKLHLRYKNVLWFRRYLVFRAHTLLSHSTLGVGVIKKKMTNLKGQDAVDGEEQRGVEHEDRCRVV